MVKGLTDAGFAFSVPEGAYYIMADFSALSDLDDMKFAHWMTKEVGVATVPGSSFYHDGGGKTIVRFAFCKQLATLEKAAERLANVRAHV
jgi:aminotransferase